MLSLLAVKCFVMASEINIHIVTILYFLLAQVTATSVVITKEWKPDAGWDVTCTWNLYMNDTLQSVKLAKNKQQFFIFRPETQYGILRKTNTWDLVESVMKVDCLESVEGGVKGKCVLTVEPRVPPKKDFTFGCEVSGERPYFRMAEDEVTVEALVPPNNAMSAITTESGPVTLNCTSSGLPAPSIFWTVEGQRVPPYFHSSPVWNATSKLWDVWSSFIPQPEVLYKVQCTSEVLKENQSHRKSLQYNDAYRIFAGGATLTLTALAALLL